MDNNNTNTNTTPAATTPAALVGRTIRSFDWAMNVDGEMHGADLTGERAHYMEGTVISVDPQTLMISATLTRIVRFGVDAPAEEVAMRATLCTPLLKDGFGDNRVAIGTIKVIA